MAVFGRRQPHAPLILRGAQFQPPVGEVNIFGQQTAQHAASRHYRRSFPPIIRRGGPRPSVADVVLVGQAVRTAWDRAYRRQFPPIIKRAGGRRATADLLVVQAQPAYRPVRRGVFISKPPPPAVVSTAPIGEGLVFGQQTAQAAASRFYRRSFSPILKRGGGRRAVADVLVVQAQPAYRPLRRSVFISKAPPAPVVAPAPVAHLLMVSQATEAAADRFFRRAFGPIIKRAGGRRATARLLVTKAQPPYRPVRPGIFISKPPPAPPALLPPIGRALLFGETTSQLAIQRIRRSFAPIIKAPPSAPLLGELIVDVLAFVTIQDTLEFAVIEDTLAFLIFQDTLAFVTIADNLAFTTIQDLLAFT